MKKLYLSLLFINLFITINISLCEYSHCEDSIKTNLFKEVIRYIKNDSDLNLSLIQYSIKDICISNSLVYLSNSTFLEEYVNFYFSFLDSNIRNNIRHHFSYILMGCEPMEVKNYYNIYGTDDSCQAILYLTEVFNDFIRAEVILVPSYKSDWDYSTVSYNGELIYSFLFFIENNKINKVFSQKMLK